MVRYPAMGLHDIQSKGQFEIDEASPERELAYLSQQSDICKNRRLLNRAGVTDRDCHEYRTGLPRGLPYGYVPRSDKIR